VNEFSNVPQIRPNSVSEIEKQLKLTKAKFLAEKRERFKL
jgi:hypothetical protein